MLTDDGFTYWRSRVATLTRQKADPGEITEARRNMRAARLADQVESTIEGFPPLTDTQREHIADILRPRATR